jgi:hypothetical protein
MSREKQIDEMAKLICNFPQCINYNSIGECKPTECQIADKAEALYNAGYRKQSEPFSQPHENGGEWISVEERLPEEDETVLYYDEKYVSACMFFSEEFNTLDTYESSIVDGVTHWMPLPEPPKMKGGAE